MRLDKYCKPLLDWLRLVLIHIRPHIISPLAVIMITAPVPNQDLFFHCHQLLVDNLSVHEPSLYRTQGSLTAEHIGEFTVELCTDR